nr:MAG TPA: hypothetical protein [Caudoviricetes sp.]
MYTTIGKLIENNYIFKERSPYDYDIIYPISIGAF